MKNTKTYISNGLYWRLIILPIFAVIVFGLFSLTSKVIAIGTDISRSYFTNSSLVAGNLVSLDKNKSGYVVIANSNNNNQLVGISTSGNESSIALDQTDNKTQVAINGIAPAMVSTINGDIKTGDYIAQSAISGVGAKALPGDKTVGVAQAAFNSESTDVKKQRVLDVDGHEYQVYVGKIAVVISVGSFPNNGEDKVSTLERWASSLVGHKVSLARIIFCGVIAIIAIVSMIVIVYGSIHSSIVAVSRNPLAKPMIFEAMAQVFVMVILISVISLTTMYLVIRI
jgi:hypothetical protein